MEAAVDTEAPVIIDLAEPSPAQAGLHIAMGRNANEESRNEEFEILSSPCRYGAS